MDFDEDKVNLQARLSAQRHVLAFALASANRNLPDAEDALKEFSQAFTEEWTDAFNAKPEISDALRTAMIEGYIEEVSATMRLASKLVSKMKPAS